MNKKTSKKLKLLFLQKSFHTIWPERKRSRIFLLFFLLFSLYGFGQEISVSGTIYDYGLRNENNSTNEGGDDILYGRFLDELGWEFNQEGRRRQDMIRFGVFTSKSWFSHNPNGSYRSLFPIPQSAINSNNNLTQNPGY